MFAGYNDRIVIAHIKLKADNIIEKLCKGFRGLKYFECETFFFLLK